MKNTMKKLTALAAASALALSLAACGGGTATNTQAPAETGSDPIRVAVIKQMDHASLDEIASALTTRLDEIMGEEAVSIEYQVTSGQNDSTVLRQLADQAIADGADVIIPIGTSDALDTGLILDMMLTQNPEVEKVGLLYSLSEPNSEVPIAAAKDYLDGKGVNYVEATANTNDEVIAAASTLIADGVDAIFTPTDNIIMNAELAIYEDLIAAGIPHYTGADSFVRNGAFATCGVNYTDLGAQTAELAYRAVTEGMDGLEDYYQVAGNIITVNTETAAGLGIDPAVFEGMGGEVVSVTTTED